MKHDIYKKDLTLVGVLVQAWDVFTKNIWLVLGTALIFVLPVNILLYFEPLSNQRDGYYFLIQLLNIVFSLGSVLAFASLAKQYFDGKKPTLIRSLKDAILRFGQAFLTLILMLFGIFMTLVPAFFSYTLNTFSDGALADHLWYLILHLAMVVLSGIAFIFYYVSWSFSFFVVMLNKKSFFRAMHHSQAVILGRWWKVFGYKLVYGLIAFSVGFLMGFIVYFVLPESIYLEYILNVLVAFATSYFILVAVVFYLNLEASTKKSLLK